MSSKPLWFEANQQKHNQANPHQANPRQIRDFPMNGPPQVSARPKASQS